MAVISASPVVALDGLRSFPRWISGRFSPVPALVAAIAAAFLVTLVASVTLGRQVATTEVVLPDAPVVVESTAYPAWTVSTGDTLWTIAERTRPEADPRAVVLQIQVLNGITTEHVLQAGDVLQLPAA